MDTEEAEDQALEDSEAGECRDTGQGQDTLGSGVYFISWKIRWSLGDWLR